MGLIRGLILLVYVIVGMVVAERNDYLMDLDSVEAILSLLLAILLWPLVLLDVNLMIGEGTIDAPDVDDDGPGDGGPDGGGQQGGGGGGGGGQQGGGGN